MRIPRETLEARLELLARLDDVLRDALRNTLSLGWAKREAESLERLFGKQGKK